MLEIKIKVHTNADSLIENIFKHKGLVLSREQAKKGCEQLNKNIMFALAMQTEYFQVVSASFENLECKAILKLSNLTQRNFAQLIWIHMEEAWGGFTFRNLKSMSLVFGQDKLQVDMPYAWEFFIPRIIISGINRADLERAIEAGKERFQFNNLTGNIEDTKTGFSFPDSGITEILKVLQYLEDENGLGYVWEYDQDGCFRAVSEGMTLTMAHCITVQGRLNWLNRYAKGVIYDEAI